MTVELSGLMRPTRRSLLLGASSLVIARTGRAATTLRIGDQRGNMRAVLEAADALRGVPYDISWVEFPAAAPLIEAMNAEAIELGVVGDAPFTFGFAAGVPMRVIAARRSTQQGLAIVVPGNSPAHTLADLEGKRIATGRGSIGHFLVLAALKHAGLPVDAVKLVFLLPADAKAALASGSVDAWSTWEPYTSQVEVIDGGRQIVNGVGIAPGQGFQIASLAAIASKHDQLADFLTRLTFARRWANAHVGRYAEIWAKLMNFPASVPQHWFARTSEEVVLIDDRAISDEQTVIDLYSGAGLLRTKFTAASAFDASFNAAIRRGQTES
ncbi:MAG TPA: ABC transporter substrate-binding protein [Acetobacteraceae bacterium]|nr:ABC transporter substrate-binding protein [Acetobacteraceae bacterium]